MRRSWLNRGGDLDARAREGDVHIEHVAEAAHMAPAEQPERVAELVSGFLG